MAITKAEANALSDEIVRDVDSACEKVARAKALEVWKVLDFPTWEAYVEQRLGMSRSRSYQLLNQHEANVAVSVVLGFKVTLTEGAVRGKDVATIVNTIGEAAAQNPPKTTAEANGLAKTAASNVVPIRARTTTGGSRGQHSRSVTSARSSEPREKSRYAEGADFFLRQSATLRTTNVRLIALACENAPKRREKLVAEFTSLRAFCDNALAEIAKVGGGTSSSLQLDDSGGRLPD